MTPFSVGGWGAALAVLLAADGGARPDANLAAKTGDCDIFAAKRADKLDVPVLEAFAARGAERCDIAPGCSCPDPDRPPRCASKAPMIRALLSHGADPNAADVFGKTPLDMVAEDNLVDDVDLLLKAGARPTGRDINGDTIWDLMQRPDSRIVQRLLAHGADPNEPDGSRGTPLHALAMHWPGEASGAKDRPRFMAVAELLLAHGADVRASNDAGDTA